MKKSGLFILSLILFFLPAGFGFSDEVTTNLQSFIIETFDNPNAPDTDESHADPKSWPSEHRWMIRGSKFSSIIKTDSGEDVYPKMAHVRSWPENLYRKEPEGKTLRVLGIHGKFDRMGYNYVEIYPAKTGKDQDGRDRLEPTEILLPGRVKNLDLWVWGANFDYYLEVHLMDYRGINHVLPLGTIKYKGWRNLAVNIPNYIPQSIIYAPALKGLKLVKFVMWTKPTERVDDFYVYFDEIKVFSDMFEDLWDGEGLGDPVRIQELWSEAESQN
ncbi:MAG: flagellar filament outer layer protein FlaA [Spirochaetales bacterium]|jgi:hypothetical protein|nr:flagellar filament outer layer protein FlaA [Spirochaetales bacterium]